MKTFFDGENGMSEKKSYYSEYIDINVVIVTLRKTRPRRQKVKCMEEIITESLAVFRVSSSRPLIVLFMCVSCNPRSNQGTILAFSLSFNNVLKITIYN